MQIHTPEEYGGKAFDIQSGTGFPFNVTEAWAPTIWAYQRMAMYGEMPESFESILEKTRVFLAGWRSVLNGGKVVRPEEVPEDWEAPVELPSRPEILTRECFGSCSASSARGRDLTHLPRLPVLIIIATLTPTRPTKKRYPPTKM